MNNKPTHHILLPENYTNANGEEKTSFTRVGSAWAKETGNLTCELRPGLALSGRFVIALAKDNGSE